MKPDIVSEDGLMKTIEARLNNVVAILCDEASDLEKIESKLKIYQIPFTLYDPYKHDYEVIIQFLDQVESQRKGQTSFHRANHSLGESTTFAHYGSHCCFDPLHYTIRTYNYMPII